MTNLNPFTKEEFRVSALDVKAKALIEGVLTDDSKGKRCVFGINEYTQLLDGVIEVDFYIDDFAPKGSFYLGKPVITRSEIPQNALVINCVCNSNAYGAMLLLGEHQKNTVGIVQVCDYLEGKMQYPKFVAETRAEVAQNFDKLSKVYYSLKDDKSKKTFKDVLKFRLSGDCDFLKDYAVNLKEQYFAYAEFLKLSKDVFVDCGGFDGDTSEEFMKRCPDFDKIYFFEPCEENFAKAQKRLQSDKIVFAKKGVSDEDGVLKFSESGSASGVCDDGALQIEVVSIDNFVQEKVTFIKMDLEGWELPALRGAQKHIIEYSPKLAVAVYHSACDFWKIFEYVKSLNPHYEVYLRHYTQGFAESIMFFV